MKGNKRRKLNNKLLQQYLKSQTAKGRKRQQKLQEESAYDQY